MRRLRSRLIAAFLGVAFLAMVPLALISYYTLQVHNQKVRGQYIERTLQEINDSINQQSNIPTEIVVPLARSLQERFDARPDLLELLEYSDSLDDPAVREQLNRWEKILWIQVDVQEGRELLQLNPQLLKQNDDSTRRFAEYPIKIIPRIPYQKMQEWLDDVGVLYEEEGRLYCYKVQSIFKGKTLQEIEEAGAVGALFCKILLIEKHPEDPSRPPDMYLRGKRFDPHPILLNPSPTIFEKYLTEDELARLFAFPPYKECQSIDIDWVQIEANDTNWPNRLRKNLGGMNDNPDERINVMKGASTVPLQMKLIPIQNHRKELSAVMVLAVPITSILLTLGFSLLLGYGAALVVIVFAAVLFSRTISRPIHELATAAQQMAEGNFDARVQSKGTEEHRILSTAFNQLASRIQNQLVHLRKKTEELETSNRELSQTKHFLQNILANIHTGVMSIGREGTIGHINSIGETILRISDWKDKKSSDLFGCPAFVNLILYAMRQDVSVHEHDVPYELDDGSIVPLQVSIVPVLESGEFQGLVVTFHDLSAIRQLEEQVRRQDRLAALGRMTAGVAHEIRNPLGIIRGSAELLRKRFAGQEGEEGLTDFILDEVKRLSRVVNDFLLFARPPEPNLEELPVETLFNELEDYFNKQELEKEYSLKIEYDSDIPPIAADLNLCRQIFLNLFLNAQDSMPGGGEIILRARIHSQREIVIEIEDQGEGIQSDKKDKIFDPFYTSKDTGTGLGLSLVHQIVSNHNGRIEVESVPGKGSIFRLIFLIYASRSSQEESAVFSSLFNAESNIDGQG